MKTTYWGNESKYLNNAFDSTWISGGEYTQKFEDKFANLVKVNYAFAVANGTGAIHLSLIALGLKRDDEIIVPSFSFLAVPNVALNIGIKPIFVDCDLDTWCMDPKKVELAISDKTKAIAVVHPYGNLCNMNALLGISKKHNIPLLEDAAEGFPSRYEDKFAGTLGNIGTYSFHATKTITTGEGGMVVTNDEKIAESIRLYRSHGLLRKRHYWHEVPGLNYRLTNLQSAIGLAQIEKIDQIISARKFVFETYKKELSSLNGIKIQRVSENVDIVMWAIGIIIDKNYFPQGRDKLLLQMKEKGIELRPGFYSPFYLEYFDNSKNKNADFLSQSIVVLPSYAELTLQDIRKIVKTLSLFSIK